MSATVPPAIPVTGHVEPPRQERPTHGQKNELLMEALSYVSCPAAFNESRHRLLLARLRALIAREKRYLGLVILLALSFCSSAPAVAGQCVQVSSGRVRPCGPSTLELAVTNGVLDAADWVTTERTFIGKHTNAGEWIHSPRDRNPIVNWMPNRAARFVLFASASAAATVGMGKLRDHGHPGWAKAARIAYMVVRINSVVRNAQTWGLIKERTRQRNRDAARGGHP